MGYYQVQMRYHEVCQHNCFISRRGNSLLERDGGNINKATKISRLKNTNIARKDAETVLTSGMIHFWMPRSFVQLGSIYQIHTSTILCVSWFITPSKCIYIINIISPLPPTRTCRRNAQQLCLQQLQRRHSQLLTVLTLWRCQRKACAVGGKEDAKAFHMIWT